MNTNDLIRTFTPEAQRKVQPRPYFNHSVEFKGLYTPQERTRALDEAGLNVFNFPADMVTGCDLLSDSGTTTMSNEQWAALHLGDESYGSNRGYFKLREAIRETFGSEYFSDRPGLVHNAFIFHQGRSCEDALFTTLGALGSNLLIPNNGHFDTTQANIEANHIEALNLFSPELRNPASSSHFKGNMDVQRFEELLKNSNDRIPVAYLTLTNNTGGGQPVSMANIKEVFLIAHLYHVPLFFDACRFAENAWFIKQFEEGYTERSIPEIVHEMFTYADGFTISFKKDGMVNMGGGLFFKEGGLFLDKYPHIPDAIFNYQIQKEGHPTYGGLSGRDIMALAVGLKVSARDEYLEYRIGQVKRFGNHILDYGLPILEPTGGHAVYLDVNRFFEGTKMQPGDFGGISLTALLLSAYGTRGCELGYFAFGTWNPATGEEKLPEVNFVRFAVPRLRYEDADLESVAESLKLLHDRRDRIPGVEITYGRELALRHFKARFRFKDINV
jgi:tryptophanase